MYPIPTLGPQIWLQAPGPCGGSFTPERKNGAPQAHRWDKERGGKERPRSDVGAGESGRDSLKPRHSPVSVGRPGFPALPVLRTGCQLSSARLWGAEWQPLLGASLPWDEICQLLRSLTPFFPYCPWRRHEPVLSGGFLVPQACCHIEVMGLRGSLGGRVQGPAASSPSLQSGLSLPPAGAGRGLQTSRSSTSC